MGRDAAVTIVRRFAAMRRCSGPLVVAFLLASACAGHSSPIVSFPAEGVEHGPAAWSDEPAEPAKDLASEASASDRGDCVLVLRAFDDSGTFVATRARLWRLDVPADATWERGDHVQRTLELPAAAARVEGLPTGKYRLQIEDQRVGSLDPPEFDVGSEGTSVQFHVRPPRKFHVRLVVVDESGRRLNDGRVGVGCMNDTSTIDAPPAWAHPRRRVDGVASGAGQTIRACGSGPRPESFRPAVADALGFDFGEFDESSRSHGRCSVIVVEIDGRTRVSALVDGGLGADATFYGVAAPPAAVLAHVEKPDGSRVDFAQDAFGFACCDAKQFDAAPRDGWWRDAEFDASAVMAGFEILDFTWTSNTAAERRVMKPDAK
jgi:hypothetical protein